MSQHPNVGMTAFFKGAGQGKVRNGGFTLIEIIGVLAIIAILAAIIAPNVIKELQSARQDAEEETLSLLAFGLENYILENRIIPQSGFGTGTWSTNIASQIEVPSNEVYQNDLNCDRRYWFDPSTNLNGLSDQTATYNQNTVSAANLSGYTTGSTATAPTNPRAMLISDLVPGCTSNINGVTDTAAKFDLVWEQADSGTDPLVEGTTLKIKRINLSGLFETVTLLVGNGSLFSRKTYSNPNSTTPFSGTAGPIISSILTVEKNSHIFSVSYNTGGFEPTNTPDGTAVMDVGYTSGGNEFVSAANVVSGVTSTPQAVTYTSTADITVYTELTIAGTNVYNGNSGYIDITLEYIGEPQYKLEGQTGTPTTISITTPGTPEIISFNLLNGTELSLYDQSWTAGSPTGDLLLSIIIKESDSFTYSSGPPTVWGR